MFLTELAEPQLLVIYPGRFQPFHKGHHAVYEWLTGKFGRSNVYIATSNKHNESKSPFTFAEKSYFMQLTGVPADRIVQAVQPYQIKSILDTGHVQVANPKNTVVIFAVSQKDMAEDPRFDFAPKQDGSDPYFQPLRDIGQAENMEKHGYIMTVPTFDFAVGGQPMQSGTELRKMYAASGKRERQHVVKDLFGRYTQEAEQILTSKLVPHKPVKPPTLHKKVKLEKVPKPEPVAEAGGVGVVRGGNDPRYVMATAGDQNAVTGATLGKEMRAFGLTGRKSPGASAQQKKVKSNIGTGIREDLAWVRDRLGESAVDKLAARHIEFLNQDIDEIKQRIATEELPAQYVEKLKEKIAALEKKRLELAFNPQ